MADQKCGEKSKKTKNDGNVTNTKLFRILCFHGYRQDGEVFKKKIGSLRKALKKQAEFIFITAPNKIPSQEGSSLSNEEVPDEQYAWWFSSTNMTFNSKKPSDVALGFERSLKLVEKTFEEQGPFDGVLGFSQGAAFVGILCGMQETNWLPYKFSFAIMIAGFKSLCHPHFNYYFKESSIPSLHVYGETDQCIPREMSESLLEQFEKADVILHPGGHFVPASEPHKQGYINFLQERKKEREEEESRKKKQIQVGSFILQQVEDSGSEEGEDNLKGNDDVDTDLRDDSSEEIKSGKTKANKGGITKQDRRKMLLANKIDKNDSNVSEIKST